MTLLEVDNLSVEYETSEGNIEAVKNVSFEIQEGERFGLVGESGCGKTTLAKSIIRLLPENGEVTKGSVKFKSSNGEKVDLVTANNKKLRQLRWEEFALISQSAMNALDPVYTVGDQIIEAIQLHRDVSKSNASGEARELLSRVGIDQDRVDSYPHQLSGGMRQRVMIAMALALEPSLIIADEPTTALDVMTQDHILAQIDDLSEDIGNSLLMITHDISVVSETCDRVGVMYGGELIEVGKLEQVFTDPEHPYTQGLLNAFPSLEGDESDLITIEGEPPDLTNPPTGCQFYDRCPYREDACLNRPKLTDRGGVDQAARCIVTEQGYNIQENYDSVLKETEKWKEL